VFGKTCVAVVPELSAECLGKVQKNFAQNRDDNFSEILLNFPCSIVWRNCGRIPGELSGEASMDPAGDSWEFWGEKLGGIRAEARWN
jgi:hypothetical protein